VTLAERLRRAVEGLPERASITLPVGVVRDWLSDLEEKANDERLGDLTVPELAEELDRAESTVRGWLNAGEIPQAYKLHGREWRVPQAAVRAFLERQRNEVEDPGRIRSRGGSLGDWREEFGGE
jgi:excisionase family DNA binding protein